MSPEPTNHCAMYLNTPGMLVHIFGSYPPRAMTPVCWARIPRDTPFFLLPPHCTWAFMGNIIHTETMEQGYTTAVQPERSSQPPWCCLGLVKFGDFSGAQTRRCTSGEGHTHPDTYTASISFLFWLINCGPHCLYVNDDPHERPWHSWEQERDTCGQTGSCWKQVEAGSVEVLDQPGVAYPGFKRADIRAASEGASPTEAFFSSCRETSGKGAGGCPGAWGQPRPLPWPEAVMETFLVGAPQFRSE